MIVDEAKQHWSNYARMKKEYTGNIALIIQNENIQPMEQCYIIYTWYEPNCRRDLDNIAAAKKFIQDALIEANVLKNDGWKHIMGWSERFVSNTTAGPAGRSKTDAIGIRVELYDAIQ